MHLALRMCQRVNIYRDAAFRRPMEGRAANKQKTKQGLYLWPLGFGELDEEVEVHGRKVPTRDRVPEIMVPDLKDFDLKSYVTYRAEGVHEPPIQSKDFFDTFYAPRIVAEEKNVPLEAIPDSSSGNTGLFSSLFKSKKSK